MNSHPRASRLTQRGVALMIVMVVLMLATLLVVGAARTAWFSERLTGVDADHARAFANAQAVLLDAEYDVRGESPDGKPCVGTDGATGKRNCRGSNSSSADEPWIPRQGRLDFVRLREMLTAQAPPDGIACTSGICLADALPQDFWKRPKAELARIQSAAARYAQFSGATAAPASNPLLATKAWYWIEILPYAGPLGTARAPDADNPFIFRITALAEGRRPSTQVVLQRLFVWKRVDS